MEIKKVTDPAFKPYGKVITGYDCGELLKAMEQTPLPEEVIYVASVPELEQLEVCQKMEHFTRSIISFIRSCIQI